MSKKAVWLASIIAFLPLVGVGFLVWHGMHTTTDAQQAMNNSQNTYASNSGGSVLGISSGQDDPLGGGLALSGGSGQGSPTASASTSPQSANISTPTNSGSDTQNSSSATSSSSSATLDPSQFGQYDKYKDGTNALFGDAKVGDGTVAAAGKTLVVNYKGWLTNGQLFDQNLSSDKPFSFVLGAGSVIAGWEQGLNGMKVNGERLVIVPPAVGYGAKGQGSIPANAVLVFYVKLLAVK